MAFGLCGAHRTGKTTLARELSDVLEMPFYDGSCGRIMRELGYNSVSEMSLETRIEAQNAYLDRYLDDIGKINEVFITDRTPVDMAAYMLGEMTMHADPQHSDAICAYVAKCIDAHDAFFDTTIIVRPFGAYVVEEGKPAANYAYQGLIQSSIEGLTSEVCGCVYRLSQTDPQERLSLLTPLIRKRLGEMCVRDKGYVLH